MAKEEEHADDMKKILDPAWWRRIRPEKSSHEMKRRKPERRQRALSTLFGHFRQTGDGRWRQLALRASGRQKKKLRILIVDDDLSVRKVLYRILENGGYDVLSAGGGAGELAGIAGGQALLWAATITDYNLPGMTGLGLRVRMFRDPYGSCQCCMFPGAHPDPELRADLQNQRRGDFCRSPSGERRYCAKRKKCCCSTTRCSVYEHAEGLFKESDTQLGVFIPSTI